MPPAHPPEFRRRAIELARERAKPIARIAADIGISESWLPMEASENGKKIGAEHAGAFRVLTLG